MNTEREKRRNEGVQEFRSSEWMAAAPTKTALLPRTSSRPELPNSGTPELLL
jgi:hypothetical protein